MNAVEKLIEHFALQPHPEGGYYRETYRAVAEVNTSKGVRSAGTAILYLLYGHAVSRFHRIDADEIWHYHQGGDLMIHSLTQDGRHHVDRLSSDNPQVIIPARVWFGAHLAKPEDYCLVGCTVSPGFEFSGFELATRETLLVNWPNASNVIERLT